MSLTDETAKYDHAGFITHSVAESVAFWQDVMGFRAEPVGTRREAWIAGFMGVPGAAVKLVHLYGLGTHLGLDPRLQPRQTRAPARHGR